MASKKFTVEELKTRLDKFLAEQFSDLSGQIISRGKIQRDIELGAAKVNGKVQESPKFVVRKDDKTEYAPIKEEAPGPKNIPLVTLYNNHGLLILDKPAGLVVHPGAGFKGDSLAQALLYHFKDIHLVGEEGRSGIVHRLDKDTSGVIMVALTQEMYEHLKDAFAERKIKKEYIALVKGKIEQQHGQIDAPLGKSQKDFRKYTTNTADMVREKPSLTEYWVEGYFTDGVDFFTLIKVKLHTGRTHQIRVHFSSLGFPLIGDELYGGKKVMKFGLNRQFLHAKKIEVQLPDSQWIEAETDMPKDLKDVLNNLKKL
ncbi:MAG TPA: RluA family pseudouridine synthase [Patescibacteria group bacterium]|jgi:23S rRNA pseudouridine1911/1915/1917 synthase|nr:RluA family pseudouridine synthase [Patescibacteria group bacterium]